MHTEETKPAVRPARRMIGIEWFVLLLIFTVSGGIGSCSMLREQEARHRYERTASEYRELEAERRALTAYAEWEKIPDEALSDELRMMKQGKRNTVMSVRQFHNGKVDALTEKIRAAGYDKPESVPRGGSVLRPEHLRLKDD